MTEDNTADAKGNAKAQAAADKAYRKASRPWFKKKRYVFPLILVAIIMISALANGGKRTRLKAILRPRRAPMLRLRPRRQPKKRLRPSLEPRRATWWDRQVPDSRLARLR
jgi:hypothetical protein